MLGLYFLYITGARPNEAAYVALTRRAIVNPYTELNKKYPWVIRMPKKETKTGVDYEWYIHRRHEFFIDALCKLKREPFDKTDFIPKLRWFHKALIQKDVTLNNSYKDDGHSLTFRSVRRYHANCWYKYYQHCKAQKVEPVPNPLQHDGTATMIAHYIDAFKKTKMMKRQELIDNGEKPKKRMEIDYDYDPACEH